MSATFIKMIFASFSIIGGLPYPFALEESEAVEVVRDEDPDEGGVGGVVWNGAECPGNPSVSLTTDEGIPLYDWMRRT